MNNERFSMNVEPSEALKKVIPEKNEKLINFEKQLFC